MGREVLPYDKDYILDILDDVFFYIKQGKTKFSRPDIEYDEFFTILQPFFISSFQSLAQNLPRDKFKRFISILPQNPHPVILCNFIQSFSPSLLVSYSTDLVRMLQKIQGEGKYKIYKLLFDRLSGIGFQQSGEFIMLAWTDLNQIKSLEKLLELLGPFSAIVFKNLPRYEKNKFYSLILERFNELADNVRHFQPPVMQSFKRFLTQLLEKIEDISDILALEPFIQVINYFPAQSKSKFSSSIVEAFLKRQERITDPVVVHIVLSLIKNVTSDKVSKLALAFLDRIDFGKDLEQTLNFYGQMRASFNTHQAVIVSLIYKGAGLTYKARTASNGRITNKLIAFLQAALAFCYITVPVLQNDGLKMKLYLYLSEVALSNNLISQATSLIMTCITELAEVQLDSDMQVYGIFERIIGFLIVVPDDPENQYLFLFNGLFQAFSKATLRSSHEAMLRLEFHIRCIVYLSCQAQERLPFHIDGVTSNDALFKSIDFRRALVERITQIGEGLEELIGRVAAAPASQQLDNRTLYRLSWCMFTLVGTFQPGQRLKNILKVGVKTLQKYKDRVFGREQKGMQGPFRTCLSGLNKKLAENEFGDLCMHI